MKNTKKYLSTGVALAITLFAAVQTIAMERPVNPYLSEQAKQLIKSRIEFFSSAAEDQFDPKSQYFEDNPSKRAVTAAIINAYKDMYYGNKPYTDDEIEETMSNTRRATLAKFNQ